MITLSVDSHKHINVAVAADEHGRVLADWEGANRERSWRQLRAWGLQFGDERQWGIEGAWGHGRGLAQELVAHDEVVYEINPRLTAQFRRRSSRMDKNDRLDAKAVASAVLREGEHLSPVTADDWTVAFDVLSRQREELVAEATRLRNRIHASLEFIDPDYGSNLPKLSSPAGVKAVARLKVPAQDPVAQARVQSVRLLAKRLELALEQAEMLKTTIRNLRHEALVPLLRICGVGELTAGALAGILGPGRRFQTEAQLATYAGVAPVEASSAGVIRHRLSRRGDRRLNAILHRIALTQSRASEEAKAYLERRQAQGKSRRDGIRLLKRYIVRRIWAAWKECLDSSTVALQAA